MIVLAVCLIGTLFSHQIVLSTWKKMAKVNLPGAKVNYLWSNSKYNHGHFKFLNTEQQKGISVYSVCTEKIVKFDKVRMSGVILESLKITHSAAHGLKS